MRFSGFRLSFMVMVVLALTLSACISLKPTTSKAPASLVLYNPGKNFLHPQYRIYHSKENESVLFLKFLTSEVLFNQANAQGKNLARLRIKYTLFSSLINNEVAKRDTQEVFIDRETVKEQFTASVKIPTTPGKTYLLDISIEDQIRGTEIRDRLLVDRFSPDHQQNWLVLSYPDNKVSFEHFFYPGESFRFINNNAPPEKIYISVFAPRNALPLPPYSLDEPLDNAPFPDSTFYMAYSEQLLYKLGGQGIYVFHFKQDVAKGLCLTQFGGQYPQVSKPDDMLPPLQYLTTNEEYQKMVANPDRKGVVDQYWLDKGKTFANARDLIRIYYNRVVFANLYFSSSKQGWNTDRGMIYVLLGPPKSVEKTETCETWFYQTSETGEKITFEFNLTEDFWIGYDYKLHRKEEFRPIWNQAVDSWRRGKIFSL